jgi:RNA polymerase sigma-70 factor (ECF subfamily)
MVIVSRRSGFARKEISATQDKVETPGDAWFRNVSQRELARGYRLAGYVLGNAHEAEDAMQDALQRAWEQRTTLRDLERAQPWFDRILVNTCRYRLRRRRSRVRWISPEEGNVFSDDPFAQVLARDQILRGLAGLDPEHRIVIVLRYWGDLSLEAIAERLDLPLGTIKSRIHYALRDLRVAVGPVSTSEIR